MYIQDFFVKYYDYRPSTNSVINKIIGNSSKILAYLGNLVLPIWFSIFPNKNNNEMIPVIVSLTSFPARINKVWLVIECMLRQTKRPKEIRLYLSKEQFPTKDSLPNNLNKYIKSNLLQIYLVNDDIKSHKKYWYIVDENSLNAFITIDDDIIYSSNILQLLWEEHIKNEKKVIACYCHKIKWNNNTITPYSTWKDNVKIGESGHDLFFGSGGGVLFPYGSLIDANQPFENIKQTCLYADDIWLNAYVRKNGYSIINVKRKGAVPEWFNRNNFKLNSINNGQNLNDQQLHQVISFFVKNYNINPFKKL